MKMRSGVKDNYKEVKLICRYVYMPKEKKNFYVTPQKPCARAHVDASFCQTFGCTKSGQSMSSLLEGRK